MPIPKHRLQIYLPLSHNPDEQGESRPVDPRNFESVAREILDHFSEVGYSWEFIQRTRTFGKYKGRVDEHRVIIIDVHLTEQDFRWWIQERQALWASPAFFDQDAIYIVSSEILVY